MTGAVDTSRDEQVAADVVTVTVGDNATIFEGPDTIYRYDLPGSGVVEGWALAAVVDQIKQLTTAYWPEIEVVVEADEAATEMLTRTLLNKGVAAYASEALREVPLPTPDEQLEITRPTSGTTHRSLGLHPVHIAIAVVIVVVAGVSWWAIDSTTSTSTPDPTAMAEAEELSAAEDEPPAAPESPGAGAADPAAAPGEESEPANQVVVEHSGLRVAVPYGFRPEMKEELLMVVGDDPDLRIHLAADPAHQVPEEAVYAEIAAMITGDETLELLAAADGEGNGKMVYREDPGDGSTVTWTTWVSADHQFSVGCHTRVNPTLPQQAACRMASESLSLS